MIRIALECALVFLLPAAIYFGYMWLITGKAPASTSKPAGAAMPGMFDEAPLGLLFALGCVCLFATLMAFATLQDDSVEQPYAPAIYKDGQIQKGHTK